MVEPALPRRARISAAERIALESSRTQPMSMDELREFIRLARWQFAKSMPENPHEYTHRKWNDPAAFESAVMLIRREGYKKRFGGAIYIYLDIDGYSYWTMGAPLDITIILNRAVG